MAMAQNLTRADFATLMYHIAVIQQEKEKIGDHSPDALKIKELAFNLKEWEGEGAHSRSETFATFLRSTRNAVLTSVPLRCVPEKPGTFMGSGPSAQFLSIIELFAYRLCYHQYAEGMSTRRS